MSNYNGFVEVDSKFEESECQNQTIDESFKLFSQSNLKYDSGTTTIDNATPRYFPVSTWRMR